MDAILKYSCLLAFVFFNVGALNPPVNEHALVHKKPTAKAAKMSSRHLYHQIDWSGREADYEIFEKAFHGYNQLQSYREPSKKKLLTIIDFNLPSSEKRLWVIDLKDGTIPYHTWVAHGKNTGELWAREFSNQADTYKSSLGFYLTGKTYYGKHGLSLQLHGLEEGFNDQAKTRAIVMHGAGYVDKEFIQRYGRLGRSHGCPAIPRETAPGLIKLIAEGSYLFIYQSNKTYVDNSKIINTKALSSITPGIPRWEP